MPISNRPWTAPTKTASLRMGLPSEVRSTSNAPAASVAATFDEGGRGAVAGRREPPVVRAGDPHLPAPRHDHPDDPVGGGVEVLDPDFGEGPAGVGVPSLLHAHPVARLVRRRREEPEAEGPSLPPGAGELPVGEVYAWQAPLTPPAAPVRVALTSVERPSPAPRCTAEPRTTLTRGAAWAGAATVTSRTARAMPRTTADRRLIFHPFPGRGCGGCLLRGTGRARALGWTLLLAAILTTSASAPYRKQILHRDGWW